MQIKTNEKCTHDRSETKKKNYFYDSIKAVP